MDIKKYILVILIFIIQLYQSQTTIIEYQLIDKTINLVDREILMVDKDKSFYFTYVEQDNKSLDNIVKDYNIKRGLKFYRNLDSLNVSYYIGIIPGNTMTDLYAFKDILPVIDWKLFSEEKEILGFRCKKAQANFRGRKYTAWYTIEVPISLGPWKAYGLPGLILELLDDKSQFNYTAIKLIQNSDLVIPKSILEFINDLNSAKTRTYKEYVNLYDKNSIDQLHRIKATLPKQSNAVFEPHRESMREVKFEWEQVSKKP